MERIPVTAPDAAYEIVIERGLLQQMAQQPATFGLERRVIVLSDETVAALYGATLAASLPNAALVTMPAGEAHKTLDTVRHLYDALIEHRADRSTTVVALGGGVVGDTAGFVAATYMRGVRLVQMPTTLLAMVDSSVGGKVGVDVPQGKNLIGAFKQPAAVLIDPDVLATLPATERRAGMAEVLKHGFIADPTLLDSALHTPERSVELIQRAVQVKIAMVQADPYEHGVRAHLNFGHTFGHAIEQVTGYRWLHGYAVAAGMVAAVRLSWRLGMADAALVQHTETVLRTAGLPIRMGALDPQALYAAMATDKKWQNGQSRFVLLAGLAHPEVVTGVPPATVMDVLKEMCTDA